MLKLGVKVDGLPELSRAIRALKDKGIDTAMKEDVYRPAAEEIVKAALPNVPSRSGRLKGSVRALASARSGRAVAGGARVLYAGAIHWGRRRGNVGSPPGNRIGVNPIAGRPFLWNAAQQRRDVIERTAAEAMRQVVKTIGRAR